MEAHFHESSWLLHSRDRMSASPCLQKNRYHGYLMLALLQLNTDGQVPEFTTVLNAPQYQLQSPAVCVGNSCRKPSDSIDSIWAANWRPKATTRPLFTENSTVLFPPANEVLGLNLLIGSVKASELDVTTMLCVWWLLGLVLMHFSLYCCLILL